jgi:purine-binding chemotaxis protein CheW
MPHASAELLTFSVGGQRFAIEAGQVVEVVRAVHLARLPKAPAVLEGLIDWRGAVASVLDIRLRFRLPAKPIEATDHIVIARANARLVGIRVDCALGVVAVPEQAIEAIGGIAPASDYLAGVVKLPDGLLLIHDLATFLSAAETDALDEAIGQEIPA